MLKPRSVLLPRSEEAEKRSRDDDTWKKWASTDITSKLEQWMLV